MIGRTLFWYIFKDLVKIFLMANGALAGIMSFGGLLRPLTHQGLDVAQVGKLLTYFMPAMTTYSLPIAALFAATVVYGRLSADNELTACRAGGMSHLSIAFPAFVMGTLVAILSLLCLCFIVPAYTLKVEQTLYSNLAKLIAGRIQGSHEIRFGPVTIFAQDAFLPPQPDHAGSQLVVLQSPMIETVERPYKNEPDFRIPKDFYTASQAVISIEQRGKGEQRGTGKVYLNVRLHDGVKIPRQLQGQAQAGVEATDYGPIEIDSPIKEDTKFMDVWRLKRLYHNPTQSARVRRVLTEFVQRDQEVHYAVEKAQELDGTRGSAVFDINGGGTCLLERQPGASPCEVRALGFLISAPPPIDILADWAASQGSAQAAELSLGFPALISSPLNPESEFRPIIFRQDSAGGTSHVESAREAHVQVRPSGEPDTLRVTIELIDALSRTSGGTVLRRSYIVPFNAPMSGQVKEIASRRIDYYTGAQANKGDHQRLGREVLQVSNQILAESNSRVSFAISCLVLVMVGTALGMMFRSGNFLSAFAVSFVPALMTITLIVAGQRVSANIPDDLKTDVARYVNTPLELGLSLVWTGNCLNFLLAAVLLGKLQRK